MSGPRRPISWRSSEVAARPLQRAGGPLAASTFGRRRFGRLVGARRFTSSSPPAWLGASPPFRPRRRSSVPRVAWSPAARPRRTLLPAPAVITPMSMPKPVSIARERRASSPVLDAVHAAATLIACGGCTTPLPLALARRSRLKRHRLSRPVVGRCFVPSRRRRVLCWRAIAASHASGRSAAVHVGRCVGGQRTPPQRTDSCSRARQKVGELAPRRWRLSTSSSRPSQESEVSPTPRSMRRATLGWSRLPELATAGAGSDDGLVVDEGRPREPPATLAAGRCAGEHVAQSRVDDTYSLFLFLPGPTRACRAALGDVDATTPDEFRHLAEEEREQGVRMCEPSTSASVMMTQLCRSGVWKCRLRADAAAASLDERPDSRTAGTAVDAGLLDVEQLAPRWDPLRLDRRPQ